MKRVLLTRPNRLTRVDAYVKNVNTEIFGERPPSIEGVFSPTFCIQPKVNKKEKLISVDELISLVNQLEPSKKKEFMAKLSLSSQNPKNGDERDVDMWSLAVYECLLASIGGGDGGMQGPASIKRLVGTSNAFRPIREFMEASKLIDLKVTERQSVYLLLAKLLVSNAKKTASYLGIPMSAKFVASSASNIASIFDQSFPGYLASGLVPVLVKSLVRSDNLSKD